MKMKLLALAVAGAMVAPMAANAASHAGGTTLYGSLRTHLQNTDAGGVDEWAVEDTASRLGVKGAEDLGGGLSAIYQYEFSTDTDTAGGILGGRLALVGLKGGFGQVAIGQQWSPYYLQVMSNKDIFNGEVSPNFHSGIFRIGESLTYNGSFGGVKVGALLQLDTGGTEDGVSQSHVAVSIPAGPVTIGIGAVSNDDSDGSLGGKTDTTGVSVNWKGGNIAAALVYETVDFAGAESDLLAVNGQFIAGNNVFTAQWEDLDGPGTADGDGFILGWQHNLSKRTRTFVEFASAEEAGVDADITSIGMRHDF